MSPTSCKCLESLNGTKIFSTLSAAARNPALLALAQVQWGEYPSVEACVRGRTCFDGGDNVIEGYPFVRELAAGVIVADAGFSRRRSQCCKSGYGHRAA